MTVLFPANYFDVTIILLTTHKALAWREWKFMLCGIDATEDERCMHSFD